MSTRSSARVTAALAIVGGCVAIVANALAPRLDGDDVEVYRDVAHNTRFEVADVLVLIAVVVVTAAFTGITRSWRRPGSAALADYGRLAAAVGGTIAVLQSALELYAYRQEARAFDSANGHNVVSAFWATNALDHLNGAMFAAWTIVLLGIAPVLIGMGQLREGGTGRVGIAAVVGGVVCIGVGAGSLLASDQSDYDIPFAVGSVIVTLWLLATGFLMWRRGELSDPDVAGHQRLDASS